jgi:hypothetical protein
MRLLLGGYQFILARGSTAAIVFLRASIDLELANAWSSTAIMKRTLL